MKKNWKIIVICCCILLLLAGFSVFKEFQGRIPSNDITVTGNTGGNLNNHGLFAEADGRVYFSNAYDGGCLYSMNPDETDLKKLTSSSVNSINVGGNYLYYYLDNATGGKGLGYVIHTYGVYRSKPDATANAWPVRQPLPCSLLATIFTISGTTTPTSPNFIRSKPTNPGRSSFRMKSSVPMPAITESSIITEQIKTTTCTHSIPGQTAPLSC